MQPQQLRRRPPLPASPIAMNNNSNLLNRPIRQVSRNMPAAISSCSGCSQPMYNPILSNVLDRLWHPDCVRCFICRCLLNDQCYSREGKLYCKDDFIKKYIHRCFACQNLIQSHEFIRRIRPGRIYHADCFVCRKCRRILQDDDIASLIPPNGSVFNDIECVCQACFNPEKKSVGSNHQDEDETTDSELSNTVNGKLVNTQLSSTSMDQLSFQSASSLTDQPTNESQSMQTDDKSTAPSETPTPPPPPPPPRPLGRPPKSRQNSSSISAKRTPAKAKVTRQKQTTNERKGRPPATRSKSSSATTPTTVQTRSSNRRNTKTSKYRKRTFSSGSDEDETEDEDDDDENDADFTDEDEAQEDERERSHSPATKSKPSKNTPEKKSEPETVSSAVPSPTTSVLTQSKTSEPLSILTSLSSNPMMKSENPPNFLLPSFNSNFPPPPNISPDNPFPPGFPLQPRLPTPLPSASITDTLRPAPPTNTSETESGDHPTDLSHPETPSKVEPSALSSLLEFGALPPPSTNPPDIRAPIPPASPYPFPFVTPGPGVPFSPQAAAGMTTYFRPSFNAPPPPPSSQPAPKKGKKRTAEKAEPTELVAQNILDDPAPPKKKARKTNPRGKGKGKKSETDAENELDETEKSSPSPLTTTTKKKKRKSKKDAKENSTAEGKDDTTANPSQNLLAQMGLMNTSLLQATPPTSLLQASSSNTSTAQQQAQIAAMYNMAPNFAAYNSFPNAYNPSFPGYPPAYNFHPAFGSAPPPGQPFPFIPPTSLANSPASPIVVPETKPSKAKSKAKAKSNVTGEKKKAAVPRGSKKKAAVAETTETEEPDNPIVPSTESAVASEPTSPPPKRRASGTESEDFDEQTMNGKSENESDGSVGNATASASIAPEKKGGRTTIKPQQLEILNKAFETCSKPNKTQREQLATDTGLNIRVIQVWFQNKRSKERKGKAPKEKETPLDDDEAGEESPPSSPQPAEPTAEGTVPIPTSES